MTKLLLIVESPTKAKTIKRYAGEDCTVKASVGHIKDLPKNRLGVDVPNGFAMELEVIRGKKKVINELRAAAKAADQVFLAPDPDREGEAIAWHIADEVRQVNPNVFRVAFNEITQRAVQEAMEHPRPLDRHLYDAQQARRVLDRLVGYEISPLLWDKVRRGLSAGRVQSVAVRLVVEREREIRAFVPVEYWTIEETLAVGETVQEGFSAQLSRIDGEKAQIDGAERAEQIRAELQGAPHRVTSVESKGRLRKPYPPLTTSKIQQAAAATFHFTAKKTMRIAQQLYEGVEIAGEGSVGLITYMRTDSTRIAPEALEMVRAYIQSEFGPQYLPEAPILYKSKAGAQDAHEAIRPSQAAFNPERIKADLSPDQYKLYELIWRTFVACQMTPARYEQTTVLIEAGSRYELRTTGSVCVFPGWLAASVPSKENGEDPEISFPPLSSGDVLTVQKIAPTQHFTQPPPRFSEGTLVKEMEERGIGRPSTYAAILETIQVKEYVAKAKGRFQPTQLGDLVTELLVQSFPEILDVDFTADMERKLDEVAEGKMDWVQLMKGFYVPFSATMEKARQEMRDVKREEIATDHLCELCGEKMVIKWGRNGYFLACSGYPKCKNTKEVSSFQGGAVEIAPVEETGEICEKCGRPMVIRRGRFGRFLACSGYPECKSARSVSTGIICPTCKEGKMVERRTRRGKMFYACDKYPVCTFSVWYEPVTEVCPVCGFGMLVRKESKKEGKLVACPVKGCGFKRGAAAEDEGEGEEAAEGTG